GRGEGTEGSQKRRPSETRTIRRRSGIYSRVGPERRGNRWNPRSIRRLLKQGTKAHARKEGAHGGTRRFPREKERGPPKQPPGPVTSGGLVRTPSGRRSTAALEGCPPRWLDDSP